MDLYAIYIYNAPKVVTLLVCSQGCPGHKLMESMTAGLHQATPLITFIGDIVFGKEQYVIILPSLFPSLLFSIHEQSKHFLDCI